MQSEHPSEQSPQPRLMNVLKCHAGQLRKPPANLLAYRLAGKRDFPRGEHEDRQPEGIHVRAPVHRRLVTEESRLFWRAILRLPKKGSNLRQPVARRIQVA